MTIPLRFDCPSVLARCFPGAPCRQELDCARHFDSLCSATEQPIDGTVLRHCSGAWCPIFVDARAAVSNPVPLELAA